MKKRPTQSRKGVKGGFPLAGSRGGAPLWGLGQRPNCFSGAQLKGNSQQRRRQRSVPASNFARPQTRPPSRSTQQLYRVAPDGRDRTAGLSDIAALFCKQEISPLRRRPKGNENRRSLRLPFGNLRGRHFWGFPWLVLTADKNLFVCLSIINERRMNDGNRIDPRGGAESTSNV